MMDNEASHLEDPEKQRRIKALCEEAGFPLAQVRQEDDVLILVPASLAALPDAEALQALSDRIERLGYRYVAFSVDIEG